MALVPISREKHADLSVTFSLLHFKYSSSLPLYAFDIGRVAGDYPIFFSPIEDTYGINMMCSIDPNLESVCITKEGEWVGLYMPANLRLQPFAALLNAEDDQQGVVCIDDESAMLGEEGEALFDDGEPTEYLNNVVHLAGQLYQAGKKTSLAIRAIQDADLLVPWEINVPRSGGETITFSDKYRIDEAKLGALEDRQFIDLRNVGALTIIYGQLFSQRNLNKLVRAHNYMNDLNQSGSDPGIDFVLDDEEFSFNFDEI